jgi:hypothetical protein
MMGGTQTVTVLNPATTVWFQSPDSVGPHFNVTYQSYVDTCPVDHRVANRVLSDFTPRKLCQPKCLPGKYASLMEDGYARFQCSSCPPVSEKYYEKFVDSSLFLLKRDFDRPTRIGPCWGWPMLNQLSLFIALESIYRDKEH